MLRVRCLTKRKNFADSDGRSGLYLKCRKRRGALAAELEAGRILETTFGANRRQRVGTLPAELHTFRILKPALAAAHDPLCRRSDAELVEQSLCVLEVGGVEALGEPAVDVREHRAPLVAAAGVTEESREPGRSTQLQGSGFDLAG